MKNSPVKKWIGNSLRLGVLLGAGLLVSTMPLTGQPAGPAPTIYPIKPVDLKSAPVTVYPQLENHPLVTWDTLAHFTYDAPDIEEEIDPKLRLKKKRYPVPGFIKSLNGENIATVGFMIPIDTDEAGYKATSFILARSQATCCYGITPKMNEWMFVQMQKGKSADAIMDIPVTVFGTLEVGEKKKEGVCWTLYRMVADKVIVPKQGFW